MVATNYQMAGRKSCPCRGACGSQRASGDATFWYACRALSALPPAIRTLLAVYRGRLEDSLGARLVELRLFGSYARGEARAESDVDVAVVLDRIDGLAERTLPMEIAGELTVEYGLVLAPIVLSQAELTFLHEREDLLAENLDREGIAV